MLTLTHTLKLSGSIPVVASHASLRQQQKLWTAGLAGQSGVCRKVDRHHVLSARGGGGRFRHVHRRFEHLQVRAVRIVRMSCRVNMPLMVENPAVRDEGQPPQDIDADMMNRIKLSTDERHAGRIRSAMRLTKLQQGLSGQVQGMKHHRLSCLVHDRTWGLLTAQPAREETDAVRSDMLVRSLRLQGGPERECVKEGSFEAADVRPGGNIPAYGEDGRCRGFVKSPHR